MSSMDTQFILLVVALATLLAGVGKQPKYPHTFRTLL